MASQVQIPFEGVILQEHSAPISCPTPNFAKGSREKRFPPRALKYLLRGQNDESAKGSQGVGKDSKGVREGPRRTLRFSINAHSIIEPVSFLCSSFSSCLSCLSCVSMFNYAANRINGTWPLLLIGIRTCCFTLEWSAPSWGAWKRGRPARILSLWPPLSFSAMLQAATLSAGTATARPKESHGAVPG